jgi:hypothetical protein
MHLSLIHTIHFTKIHILLDLSSERFPTKSPYILPVALSLVTGSDHSIVLTTQSAPYEPRSIRCYPPYLAALPFIGKMMMLHVVVTRDSLSMGLLP